MTVSRPLFAMLGLVAVLGAATLGLSQGSPAAPVTRTPALAAKDEPVLLELFTSQGCSSCPPADALAEKLATDPSLVVIARPVTYWDRLGWKDTLAPEVNTALQQAYARRGLAGQNGVYTPQLVVDGRRDPAGAEVHALHDGHVVVAARTPTPVRQLALTPDALTGLLAWLEASPPGRSVNTVV